MKRKDLGRPLSRAVTLFYFLAFLLLFVKDCYVYGAGAAFLEHWQGLALAVAVPMLNVITTHLLPRLFPADQLLLSLTNFLCALGVLVLYCTNPSYAYQQAAYYFVGLIAMVVCIYLVRLVRSFRFLVWPMMLVSLLLLALPLVIGQETYGAKNWFYVGGISVQPSEIVKLCLVIIIARFMADRRFFPWLIFAASCLGVLMLQKDLGTALLYFGTTLLVYYAASGNLWVTGLGLMGGAGAAVLGYKMFAHVKRRVQVWLDPWQDYNDAGYQIIQSLMAIASGGLFGVGLGLGSPRTIPVYHTDFIFAVICEQFGLIFGLFVLLMYVAIIWRGATTAMAARTRFHGLLAMGCTVLLGLQTFVIIGGVLKLIPLTGVTMPFVSYGGTSLASSLCLIGLLQGVASLNEDAIAEDTRLANYTG
ncbi:MAG: FtsW/RodA/SpoVE family cell cycle protein [Clostridia bacterium]|nr:FtsW/RodA/SpoVE family cell cycle protein [Clostridia bacterium]